MTALKDRPTAIDHSPPADPEVLIEEARRRQRLRYKGIFGAILAAVVAAGIFGVTAGGGSPTAPPPTARGDGSGQPLTVAWHELSAPGAALPTGMQVSDVIRYHRELVAAGSSDWPARLPRRFGCRTDCGTVVWASSNGGHWRPVFATQQNDGGNALIPTSRGLALLSPGIQSLDGGASSAPGSKTSMRKLLEHQTPSWMAGPASLSGGGTVFSIGEDDDGAPSPTNPNSNLEPAWVSTDGIHWPPSFESKTFKWRSAVKVGPDYVGLTQTASATTVLWSKNDRAWSKAAVSVPAADVAELAGGPNGAVLELIPSRYPYQAEAVQLWYSRNGRSWSRATVVGAPPVIADTRGTMPALIAADGGFLAFDRTNTGIWWSKTGRTWKRVDVTGAPPSDLEPQGVSVDGNSLLLIEQGKHLVRRHGDFGGPTYEPGPTTFWRVDLRAPSKLGRAAA